MIMVRCLLALAAWGTAAPLLAQDGALPPYMVGQHIDDKILAEITGRENILNQNNNATNNSSVRNNSVNGNSVTGGIDFSDQAFQSLSGFAIINANTGNNVSINAAMQVNLSINTP